MPQARTFEISAGSRTRSAWSARQRSQSRPFMLQSQNDTPFSMQNTPDFGLTPVVLDTQVVMDWMVFKDPSCDRLSQAVMQSDLNWCTTPGMYGELMHVLKRGVAAAWQPDLTQITENFEQHARCLRTEAPSARHLLPCRDADDQMFLDLAIAIKARWLFSRDRAVLALARRARAQDIEIISPLAWNKRERSNQLTAGTPISS